MTSREPQTVKSSEKLFTIIDQLIQRGDAGVTELADTTSFHKSTVYVHLQTMKENGFVVKSGEKYRLSLKFLALSDEIRNQRQIYREGRQEIDSLAKETGELVCLGVQENGMTVILHTARGEKASQTISDGARIPMLDSPMGKVLLAFLSEEEASVDDLSEHGDLTARRLEETAEGELLAELEAIRNDGFSVSADQSVDGIPYIAEPERDKPRSESHRADVRNRAIAAPVLHHDEPVGAVGVTGPAKRISGEYREHVRQQVVRTAAMIEKKLDVGQNPTRGDA